MKTVTLHVTNEGDNKYSITERTEGKFTMYRVEAQSEDDALSLFYKGSHKVSFVGSCFWSV